MKVNVLEKPTRPVKYVYIDVMLDHLVVSNGEREKIIHSTNTFDHMS